MTRSSVVIAGSTTASASVILWHGRLVERLHRVVTLYNAAAALIDHLVGRMLITLEIIELDREFFRDHAESLASSRWEGLLERP